MDVCKKKSFQEEGREGEQWIAAAFESTSKVVVAHCVGRRDEKALTKLVGKTVSRLKSPLDVVYTSDEWDAYTGALKNTLFEVEEPPVKSGPGRKPRPRKVAHKDLKYAVVHKTRVGGRVKQVSRKVVFGDEAEIMRLLGESSVSRSINTSFIERNNLTLRQQNRRLSRKTNGFSKDVRLLECQLILYLAWYHFVRPHSALSRKKRGRPGKHGRKTVKRTPLMAAGVTDRIWSMDDLMKFVTISNPVI